MRIEAPPAFDETVMAAELPVCKAAAKMLQLLHSLNLPQLWSHPGLNFEKLHGMIEPASGEQLYSLRLGGTARAIACLRVGPPLVLGQPACPARQAYRK